MYVHCHSCPWQQDDFYDAGYNPAKWLSEAFDRYLFGDKINELGKTIHCGEFVNGKPLRPDMTQQEFIARYYEQFGRHIREMKWTTVEQFYADPDKRCPECGSTELDLD